MRVFDFERPNIRVAETSDDKKYGGLGRNMGQRKTIKAVAEPADRMKNSITIDVPPLSVTVLKYDYK
jgi:1,4-alpha-glucan branching enzyme